MSADAWDLAEAIGQADHDARRRERNIELRVEALELRLDTLAGAVARLAEAMRLREACEDISAWEPDEARDEALRAAREG